MKAVFHGSVKDGRLKLERRSEFADFVAKFEGKALSIEVSKRQSRRSLNQNSYFHGVICELISEHTGYEPDEVKEILKYKFLLSENDDGFSRCRPTSSLNTDEMARFTDQCIRWAATELGLAIPDPERACA